MNKTLRSVFVVLSAILMMCPSASGAKRNRQAPPDGEQQKRPPRQQKRNATPITGSAVKDLRDAAKPKNLTELSLQSSKNDETALRVQKGATVSIDRLNVNKKGNATSEEDSNFYSLNAAVAVWEKSSLTIGGGQVETNAEGANAFVAYGANAELKVANLTIRTSKDSSRGLHATFGGKIDGENLTITTQGAHCAALATDRGGGYVIGRKIQAVTHGDGSPGIYSTGNITAIDCTFEAFDAEAAVIEGRNTILVQNCTMTGHRRCGTMLYQSFSGDAETGTCVFTMAGGSLTAKVGPVFYVTNTHAQADISNAKLVSGNGILIEAGSNRWGRSGKNGGHLKFHAESQSLEGDIVVNDISDVSLSLGQQTQLKGAINAKTTAGKVNLELDSGAVWNVTADSSVDSLSSQGNTLDDLRSKIVSNGHVIHYRIKQGFLNGDNISLDNGGMLVYTPAPEATVQPGDNDQWDARNSRGGRGGKSGQRPPPPPGGFGGGKHRGEAPPDGFGGGNHRGETPPDGFGGGNHRGEAPPDGFDGGNHRGETPPDGFGGGKHRAE